MALKYLCTASVREKALGDGFSDAATVRITILDHFFSFGGLD
jgi:hypothetical protein